MGFSLFIREGHGAGETIQFDELEVSFGRVADNDVVLYDPDVSREHFSIIREESGYVLRDHGSSNGTFLNGRVVDSSPLSHGDEISAGQMIFEFQVSQSERKLPSRRPRTVQDVPATTVEQGLSAKSGYLSVDLPSRGRRRQDSLDVGLGASARERFRARQAAARPVGRFRIWHSGLSKTFRLTLHISVAIVMVLLIYVAFEAMRGDEPIVGPRDYSSRVVTFERRMSEWVFGYGVDQITHLARSNIGFAFPYRDGRVTLTFDVGFVEGENEVEIRLNEDRLVGYAPMAIGSWVRDVQLVLPHNALIQNDMNTIVFDQIRNPGSRPPATWAIRNLRISEDALPAPDPRRAQERFELGQRRWTYRAVGPRNMYDACRYFREARDYLELIEVKPPLYDEVSARIRECTDELDKIYRRLFFEAQRHERFRRWDEAKATLLNMLEYFPDETDPRHQTTQNWLRNYN